MTFAQLKTEVYRRLRESSSAPVYFSNDDIETAINDGLMELSDATEWHERHLTIDLLNNRPYYDLRTVLGVNFLAPGPAFNLTTSRWLTPTSVNQVDRYDRRWELAVGQPQRIMQRGLWWVGFWPRVQTDLDGTIKQYYAALPDALAEDTDEPAFPETYHYGLVDYAVCDLFAQDGQTQRALRAWEAYLVQESALLTWCASRNRTPHVGGYVGVAG